MDANSLPRLNTPYLVAPEDVSRFRTEGFVHLPAVASAEEASAYQEVIREAAWRHNQESRPLDQRDTYGKAFVQVSNLWQQDPGVAAFVLAGRFAGIAAQLLGCDRVRIYHDQALFKEVGGGITPWHQDAMYWPLDGHRMLTMWMPLVPIAAEMGGLMFAGGSHQDGPLSDVHISDASEDHFDRLFATGRYSVSSPRAMAAGDVTFHAGRTVHRAPANLADRVREVMTIIWHDADLIVQPPANPAQAADLRRWLPGLQPGDLAASNLNPVVESLH
ncbi:phytanoyl-CoA dioxygenase family protein [Kribbella sp. NPDC026611]|uniref:phytanoyl-CoA dioxygenase family protein n=1 Tax=Kribbella sp. NPDC026611 TaxID=3154911 RepID=UPI00340CA6CC